MRYRLAHRRAAQRSGLTQVLDVLRTFIALVAIAAVTGCAQPRPVREGVKRLSQQQVSDCQALGGKPELVSLGAEACVRPTKDAGQACADSSECEGRCLAPAGATRGAAVTGTCAAQVGRLGCLNVVIRGQASGEACFD